MRKAKATRTSRLSLSLLGGFDARLETGVAVVFPPKAQALIALLALQRTAAQSRSTLVATLWPTVDEAAARHSLRQTLLTVQSILSNAGLPRLEVGRETISLDRNVIDVDVVTFDELARRRDIPSLEQAVALYRGDLLAGTAVGDGPFEEWLRGERERVRQRVLEVLSMLLAHYVKGGEVAAAVRTALSSLGVDALQEPVHRTLIQLYLREGQPGLALRQYQACVDILTRELGVAPSPETRRLYESTLKSSEAAPAEWRSAPPPASTHSGLVGRATELATLRQTFHRIALGDGQCVVISGEAGIGKTRLVGEVALGVQSAGARTLRGQAYELEQMLPFGPWLEALRSVAAEDMAAAVAELPGARRLALAHLIPEVVTGAAPSGAADPAKLFDAVHALLGRLAAHHSLAVVIEDLHWADEMSVRLFFYIARRLQRLRVLLIGTQRDDESADGLVQRTVHSLTHSEHAVWIPLGRLSKADTVMLVGILAPNGGAAQTPPLGERVWAATQGVPFFIVEMVRTVLEHPNDDATLPLPDRVHQVLTDRLARLSESARHVAAVIAVVGRECEYQAVEQAAGVSSAVVARALEELARRRLLTWTGDRCYFSHELIREVVYRQLTPPRRRALHRQVAAAIETLHAGHLDASLARLAVHFREAEAWDQAVRYLYEAGRRASAHSANREAATNLTQALEIVERLPRTRERLLQAVDLRLALRNALLVLGDFEATLHHLTAAQELAVQLKDTIRLGQIACYLCGYYSLVGEQERSISAGERALAVAERLGHRGLRAATSVYLGQAQFALGAYRASVAHLSEAAAPSQVGDQRDEFGLWALPSVQALAWLAWCMAELGEFAQGRRYGELAIRMAETSERSQDMVYACRGLGRLYLTQGEIGLAIEVLERGLTLSRQGDVPLLFRVTAALAGYAYARAGRLVEGRDLLEEAVRSSGSVRTMTLRLTWLSEALALDGRTAEALTLAVDALAVSRARRERGEEAHLLRVIGHLLSEDPARIAEAEPKLRAALALARELEMRPLEVLCLTDLATACRRTGRREEAGRHARAARRLAVRIGMRQAPPEEPVKAEDGLTPDASK